jgi:hypothetical protein
MRGVDRELLLGVGVGLILAVSLRLSGGPVGKHMTDLSVINRARQLGLIFPVEERPVADQFQLSTPPSAAAGQQSKK